MIVAVLDTNAIVSGVLQPLGIPGRILRAARAQEFILVVSAPIVQEVMATLNLDRIRRKYHLDPRDLGRVRLLLEREAVLVALVHEVHGAATHPEDDLVLGRGVSARADYLVTGDLKLRHPGQYQGVIILSPREFLEVLQAEAGNN